MPAHWFRIQRRDRLTGQSGKIRCAYPVGFSNSNRLQPPFANVVSNSFDVETQTFCNLLYCVQFFFHN